MDRYTKALEYFSTGSGCAQSVALAFQDTMGLDEIHIKKMASSFGSGMGKLQKTCGALTGAYMVIGFLFPLANEKSEKERQYRAVQELTEKFEKVHGSAACRDLLECDFNSDEGEQFFQTNDLKNRVCSLCIKTSISLLEELVQAESLPLSIR